MTKLMFVCSSCGFAAFVERPMELERAGWRYEARPDGAVGLLCSVCLGELAESSPAPAAALAFPGAAQLHTRAPR
jgi:hypothetical protein